jgi:hypothetical protein
VGYSFAINLRDKTEYPKRKADPEAHKINKNESKIEREGTL